MGLQTGNWALSVERCILVWHRDGGGGDGGREEAKKMAVTKEEV